MCISRMPAGLDLAHDGWKDKLADAGSCILPISTRADVHARS